MVKRISEQIKRVFGLSGGLAVYITKEAKKLGWKRTDYVRLTIENKKLIIEKVKG